MPETRSLFPTPHYKFWDAPKTNVFVCSTENIYYVSFVNYPQNTLNKPEDKVRLKELSKEYCWENEEKVMLEIVRNAK